MNLSSPQAPPLRNVRVVHCSRVNNTTERFVRVAFDTDIVVSSIFIVDSILKATLELMSVVYSL